MQWAERSKQYFLNRIRRIRKFCSRASPTAELGLIGNPELYSLAVYRCKLM